MRRALAPLADCIAAALLASRRRALRDSETPQLKPAPPKEQP